MTKFDRTKPCTTRGGEPATILDYQLEGEEYSLCVVVEVSPGREKLFQYNCLGERKPSEEGLIRWRGNDLINLPDERIVYLHRHNESGEEQVSDWSVDDDGNEYWEDIASTKVTFVEGDFVKDD